MTIKIGINGFGRIGRMVFRILEADPEVEVVAINDLTNIDMLAHLLRHDSVHRRFDADVQIAGDNLTINGRTVSVTAQRNPAELPWGELGVEVVVGSKLGSVDWSYPEFDIQLHCFEILSYLGRISLIEHQAKKWIIYSEFESLEWAPADRELMSQLRAAFTE